MGAPSCLEGQVFAPGQSRPVPARLEIDGTTARLVDDAGAVRATLPCADLRFEAPLGHAPRRATLPDGTLFETGDRAGVAALEGRTAGALLAAAERFHPRLALFVVATLAGAWAIWRWGLDLLVAVAIALTPTPVVTAIDGGTLGTLDRLILDPSQATPADRAAAQAVFDRLLAALPAETRAKHGFALDFRGMEGMGPNAFALPGGTVVLSDALLADFPDLDVIAGVLAHEIGHVVDQHGLRRLYRSVGAYVLITMILGDTGEIAGDILLEGSALLSLRFSREQESAADAFGVRLSRAAGYDPAGLIVFFAALAEAGGEPPVWLSTHPRSEDRLRALERLVSAPPP